MSDCYYTIESATTRDRRQVWESAGSFFPKRIASLTEARRRLRSAQKQYGWWGTFRIVSKCPGRRSVIADEMRFPKPTAAKKLLL